MNNQLPPGAVINGFTIWYDSLVYAIQLTYLDDTMSPVNLSKQGGTQTGKYSYSTTFDPDEYIVAISGRYGASVDSTAIITENSNQVITTYGPYGGNGGDVKYYYEVPPGYDFVGFWGYTNTAIDAIGVVLRVSE